MVAGERNGDARPPARDDRAGEGESGSYAYEYSFGEENQTETFYDGLNFS